MIEEGAPQVAASDVHPMGVAGAFYPSEAPRLDAGLRACCANAAPLVSRPFKAMIVPHAGLRYSGAVAASAFRSILDYANHYQSVAIISPSHRAKFTGVAAPTASAFDTPFGPVKVSTAGVLDAVNSGGCTLRQSLYEAEHGVEMMLPFIRRFLPQASIIPLVVGGADPQDVDAALKSVWGGDDRLVIISSDLSHYLALQQARERDAGTAILIDRLQDHAIDSPRACGWQGVASLLRLSRERGLRPLRLDQRTSFDATQEDERVVGYASYGFEAATKAQLPDPLRKELLRIAKATLKRGPAKGQAPNVEILTFQHALRTFAATFVTLEQGGRLRGCIGSYAPRRPMATDVVENTYAAAFKDPRFKPVQPEEMDGLDLSISILSHPKPIAAGTKQTVLDQLQPDADGLILQSGNKRAIFLPKVWESIPQSEQFVDQLMRKAGLNADDWPDDMAAFTYRAELVK